MYLGFSLLIRENDDIKGLFSKIKESGFDGVEPTFHPQGIPSPENYRDTAPKLAQIAKEIGLKIPSMRGGPLFWTTFSSDDPILRNEAIELAKKAFECLKIMGGDTLLVVPGKWESNILYSKVYNNALDTAKRISQIAEEYNITVGLENVENKFLLSPLEWSQFIDKINSPRIKVYLDIGNLVSLGLGYPDLWIRELGKERIARIHFKDAIEFKGTTYLLQGSIEWDKVINAIRDVGYDSWIIVELPLYKYHPEVMIDQTGKALKAILG
ncbi:MAG: sugar phosphate isomerase/epimerase family protein [bacterium]